MHSVLAIARVTLKDALRKKVLLTILFFSVLLVAMSGLLPWVTPAEQMMQIVKISLTGIGFFGMLVAIFLSAPSLPDDIARKTIFTVLTKPARRWQILAGKILGMAYVLVIMLSLMGAIAFGYIKFWAWKQAADPKAAPVLAAHRMNWADSIDYRDLTLAVSEPMIDSKRAIASGFDRITFHFKGLPVERMRGETASVRIVLFSHGWSYDSATNEGTAALEVKNPSLSETRTFVFGADSLRPEIMSFPKSLIDKTGAVDVTVVKRLPSGSYSAMASSVAVLSEPSGYGVNFIKALALMFMEYMVLVFIATAASTFLTSTVSIITAFFIFFTGSLTEILRDQALKLGSSTNIFTMAQHTHGDAGMHMSRAEWLINEGLRSFYLGISIVFPNISWYDPSAFISQNEYISWGRMVHGVWYAAIYAAIAFAFAWLVFRRKEVS